ncbi:AAA family ATPase [Variovorax sp. NFACC27]|uniref:AAA family ATPase n=1 Tax=unclassified Variovorax TaxID=663243 RepID=UPI00089C4910|nr:AAA domain-containing protein [Variovorax sp. NFACC28]SEG07815.1 AAA domain-containing protein [Variovorax sp. NFACC29]SFC02239.1 AAA domain-containing protein [Variovorax sp. NFACC26]SFF78148.1 AAA domain-containing protein [Variovorax sp. NFACC27]
MAAVVKSRAEELFSALGDNPLLLGLPRMRTEREWGRLLMHRPKTPVGTEVEDWQRLESVTQIESLFVPKLDETEAAPRMQMAMLSSIRNRDPRIEANRIMVYAADPATHETMEDIPYAKVAAQGAIIRGPTGGGKSSFLSRFLSHFPQVIHRDGDESLGYLKLKQLVWLVAEMPPDPSRGGLLESIAHAMDKSLGMDYLAQLGKVTKLESKFVWVIHWLLLHRCSFLVVEEAQKGNLDTPVLGEAFQRFFLRLLNSGIPVVLVGNPLAFSELETNSQNMSRLTSAGLWDYYPEFTWATERWKDLVTYVWGFTVFDSNKDKPIEHLHVLLWILTGGSPRFLARLRKEALMKAISMEKDYVDKEVLLLAANGAVMRGVRPLILALAARNDAALGKFKDQPVEYFRERWALIPQKLRRPPIDLLKGSPLYSIFKSTDASARSPSDGPAKTADSTTTERKGNKQGARKSDSKGSPRPLAPQPSSSNS